MPKRKSTTLFEEKEAPSSPHKSIRHDDVDDDDDEEYVYESDHEAEHESVSRYMEQARDDEEDADQDEEMMDTKEKKKEAQHRTTRVLQYGGHPRGVRPWGNFFFDHETEVQQQKFRHPKITGWGVLNSLEDDKLLDLIKLMDLHTLCSLSLVSRACYILCFEEEVWRHMCLTMWKGDFRYQHTWRQTVAWEYVRRKRIEREQKQVDVTEEEKALLPKSSAPIRVTSYYSDLLFQPWYCLSMDLSRFTWIDNIDRRSGLSVEQFIAEYERPMRPVILTDIVQTWPAATEWTREKLLAQYAHVIYKVGAYRMTMENYLAYSAKAREETPLYLFDNAYPTNTPEFAKQYTVPPHFSTDYFDYIEDPSLRPSYRWILIGPARSGSTFHKDPNGTSAWNGLISGAKKWILFPPDYVPPGVFPSQDDAEVITPISVMEWLIHYYHQCHDMDDDTQEEQTANPLAQHFATKMAKREQQATSCSTSRSQRRVEPIECVCRPGELIFIPAGWYHTAINIEESIAVTQNYVSEQNLGHVLTFLEKEGQPKRALREALEAGVEKHHPGLLDQVKQQNAQKNQPKPASLWSKLMAPTSHTTSNTSTFSFSSILNQQQEPEDEIVA